MGSFDLSIGAADRALLLAVIDRILPSDEDPGALELGTQHYVLDQLAGDMQRLVPGLLRGLSAIREMAGGRFGELGAVEQDELLGRVSSQDWFTSLAELVAEGFYANPGNGGNKGARSWKMLGYDHRLPDGPDGPAPCVVPEQAGSTVKLEEEYDAIVVGAGAGGGIVAAVLAEASKHVLLLERGPHLTYELDGYRDHLRNQRLSQHGHNAGPDIGGDPRVLVDADGRERVLAPHENGYHNNAAAVGSGTVVYGAQAWRFLPEDFRMASLYGVPEGSSLVDWPISYEELAPYYRRAEWEIGVAGHSTERLPVDYPMPPTPQFKSAAALSAGAESLGLTTLTPPLLINTIDRDGRPACIQCGSCIGFPCPTNSKNGTQNTAIARALKTGNCTLIDRAMVERVDTDARGRVTGVTFRHKQGTHSVRAKAVVLSGGAIESARLLLMSGSSAHPQGLGNAHDQVGRNLQGHYYVSAWGLTDQEVYDPRGPGVTIATRDFNHGNDGIIGGAMLADDFVLLPAIFWKWARSPQAPNWGQGAKDYMRHAYRRTLSIKGPVHEIPTPDCRVQLSQTVRDQYGLPVSRLSGVAHPETIKTTRFMNERAKDWLRASGAREVWAVEPVPRLSGGQHQAGTCRMGTDPKTSVTDQWGRVWGHDNLFVSDGSLHPTNGGFNPVLTIMALAFRNAEHIASTI